MKEGKKCDCCGCNISPKDRYFTFVAPEAFLSLANDSECVSEENTEFFEKEVFNFCDVVCLKDYFKNKP